MPSNCGSGPGAIICRIGSIPSETIGSAVVSGTQSAVHGIAEAMASAADGMLHALTSMWMSVGTPSLTGDSSPVTTIQNGIQWITLSVAVACILAAGGRIALRRRGEPFAAVALGLARLVIVTAAAAGLTELAGKAGDEFSASLMNAAHLGSNGWAGVISVTAITSAFGGGDGVLLVIALIVLLSALIQLMLMVLRIGLLIILTGTLPLAAAASMSDWGETWWRKHLAWLVAWLLYKPAAALLFAGAITLTNGKQSLVVVAAGFMLLAMMVLLLPAMLKLIVPATAALGAASGGSLALGAAGAAATGAIRISQAGGIRAALGGGRGSSGTAGADAPGTGDAPTGTGATAGNPVTGSGTAEAGGQGDAPSGTSGDSAERVSGDSSGPQGSATAAGSPPASADSAGTADTEPLPESPPRPASGAADAASGAAGRQPDNPGTPAGSGPAPSARPQQPDPPPDGGGQGPSGAAEDADDAPAENGG